MERKVQGDNKQSLPKFKTACFRRNNSGGILINNELHCLNPLFEFGRTEGGSFCLSKILVSFTTIKVEEYGLKPTNSITVIFEINEQNQAYPKPGPEHRSGCSVQNRP